MRRLPRHDELEKSAIEMAIKPTDGRSAHRSFAVLFAALITFTIFVLTSPSAAQDSNGSASAQQSADLTARGVYKVGGDVSAPVLIHSVEPQYPDKDGAASATGNVQVSMWVDKNGNPTHVRVIRGLGMGLD